MRNIDNIHTESYIEQMFETKRKKKGDIIKNNLANTNI